VSLNTYYQLDLHSTNCPIHVRELAVPVTHSHYSATPPSLPAEELQNSLST